MTTAFDLATIEEPLRAAAWARSACGLFPGLSVKRPPVKPVAGSIQGVRFGAGWLWTIDSPPLVVGHTPCPGTEGAPTLSIMLQLEGSTVVSQARRSCQLNRGDLSTVDGLAPFELDVSGAGSRILFLQIPRHSALSRQPDFERRTAESFSSCEPGWKLLSGFMLSMLEAAPSLDAEQRAGSLGALVSMLGVPKVAGASIEMSSAWRRLQSTLSFIDSQLSDPTLTARRVAEAQGLSRRRLDQILLESVGSSVCGRIWQRRLNQAASDLLDRRFASKTVTQIAFGAGFEDAAHFARAFKRQYGCTPREWRQGARGDAAQRSPVQESGLGREELTPSG